MPGCAILIAKDGKIAYHKAFGHFNYDKEQTAAIQSVYDMASVTKAAATTLAIMKLYDRGQIQLNKKLSDYLPNTKGTNKANLVIKDILLHQSGLVAFIPFYKEVIDSSGKPNPALFAKSKSDSFSVKVADGLYMRKDWKDTMMSRILQSQLGPHGKYVYSDNGFIFLARVVEAITGTAIDKFAEKEFYKPMCLTTATFRPMETMPLKNIAPSEDEPVFRNQLVHGTVHDPGAAMFGGVAGHAGLFSNAYDMALIMQMLLNGGTLNGKRYLRKETIELFTSYGSSHSRRGLGFDKPEKDNYKRETPYPALYASRRTFGHTGFTGTCVWADPEYNLVYIFLSNRLTPDGSNNKLIKMNVRTEILETAYSAFGIGTKHNRH